MVKKTNNMLSTKEVAEKYDVSKQSVMLWIDRGMPVYILGPKKFKYDPLLVEAWVVEESRKNKAARFNKK